MAWTPNNKANEWNMKKNHIRLAKNQMTKTEIDYGGAATGPVVSKNCAGTITASGGFANSPALTIDGAGNITAGV